MPASDKLFGLKLKELRKAAGLTQQQLAQNSGMALSSVAALEQGQYDATWPTVQALAAALGVTCEAFTRETEKESAGPKTEKPETPKKRKGK